LPNIDSTPAIAELTEQISQTRALNLELRNQLSEHASTATEVDATLNAELDSVREAKRVEDVARGELKARTKTLEDNRRAAETGKRDAERRLRATQKVKAETGTRIEKLGEEIRALEAQVQQDEVAVRVTAEAATQEELDIRARVKQRQREVRVAEEVVTALNVRVRELEDSIDRERVALAAAREKAYALQREQDSHKYDAIPEQPLDLCAGTKNGVRGLGPIPDTPRKGFGSWSRA
jgi:chromosome segregation ATPase